MKMNQLIKPAWQPLISNVFSRSKMRGPAEISGIVKLLYTDSIPFWGATLFAFYYLNHWT